MAKKADKKTEESTTDAAAETQAPVSVKMITQYIRDISFENIAAQKGTVTTAAPQITVQVALDAKKRGEDGGFDVGVKLNIESVTDKKETVFVLELDYVGIFKIENVPDEQLHPVLMIECPRLMFPFFQRVVHDIARDGGFPPLSLDQIDFIGLYRQDMQRRAEAAAAAEGATKN